MFYSKTTNGFYAPEFRADYEATGKWPVDAVEITDADYQSVMQAQCTGKVITADSNGLPIAVDPPPIPLDTRQGTVWNNIKDRRSQAQNGGVQVTVAGAVKWFNTDPVSRVQQLGLKDTGRDQLAAGGAMTDPLKIAGNQVQWKTMDNSMVLLTVQDAFDIVDAVKQLDALAFQNGEKHHQAMLAAADPLTYDYSTGWPAAFAGATA